MASGKEYVNHLALELDVVEGEGRKVYLPADSGLEEWGTSGFKARFRNILTGFAWEELYPVEKNDDLLLTLEEDEEEKASREAKQEALRQMWWEAVQETVREDADLFERVQKKCKEALSTGVEWKKIVQEVLTDVMLEMEGLEPRKALEFIFEQGFTYFPTLFLLQELLSRESVLSPGAGTESNTAFRLAIRSGQIDFVKEFTDSFLLDLYDGDGDDYPVLLEAAATGNVEIYNLLVEFGKDEKVRDKENRTVLHVMAEHNRQQLVMKLVEEEKAEFAVQDNNGRTPLHQAVFSESSEVVEILVRNGSPVNIQDAKGQTPLHIAVEKESMFIVQILLYYKADVGIADHSDETPMSLAVTTWQEGFEYLLNHCYEGEGSEAPKQALKQAMEGKKDKRAAEKIRELPHSVVVRMLQHDDSEDALQGSQEQKLQFSFIKDFVDNPSMKRSTLAILDHFVLANTCVNSEVMESDIKGCTPDSNSFEPKSKSFLAALSERGIKDIALHPAVKTLMDHKWNSFGWWLFGFLFALYLLRMVIFGAALFIAARPDLDNPGCYRNGWDYARGVFEGISFIYFLYKGYDEISEMIQFKKAYFKDYYNYLQIVSVVLPLLIIPFRAATTWCASTGGGYCTLPVNSTAMGNTSISESCIVASSVQWIVASLAYLVNALLIVEFVALFRLTGVYVRILLKILASDMIKFMVIFFVVLYIFVGTFYLALRAGVVISADGQISSDLQLFQLQTLYPWHVLFTGFRILFQTESVIDGYFAADTSSGQYTGYQWFSVVLYLFFLFVVIVVLLNLLIAQMSNTYSNIQDEAEGTYAVARARILARLEKTRLIGCGEPFRKAYYQQLLWYYEKNDKEVDRDNNEEKLLSLEKKVDSLTKMVTEIIEIHRAKQAHKEEMLQFTLPEAPTSPLDSDSDSDE